MDRKKLNHYKKKLEAQSAELARLVALDEEEGRSADDDATQDIADKANSSYTKEFLFNRSNKERFILELVDEALARIKDGSYGICAHCREEMQQKRIDAVPWARHCIDCQQKQDQGLI